MRAFRPHLFPPLVLGAQCRVMVPWHRAGCEQLQTIYGIKIGSLSDALGYDISYISKWLSGAKLPSMRSAESVCERIAAYVGTLNKPESMDAAAARLNFAYDDGGYERALAERLYAILSEQKSNPYGVSEPELNARIIQEPSGISDEITKEVIYLYRRSREERIEGILYMPEDFLSSDSIVTANRICALEGSGRTLHIRQIIGLDSFKRDASAYVRYVLRLMSLRAPISMDFYAATEGKVPVSPALVLRNGILIQGVDLSLTHGHSYSLVTSDRNVVNECYRISDNYVQTLPPLAERLGRDAVMSSNLPFSYALQQNNRYLMHSMWPVNLSTELLYEFMDKYLADDEQRDFQRKMYEITSSSFNSVITYKSTLVDYMNTGRIRLFDGVVTLTRDERRRHLSHLIDELEDGSHISIGIVSDHNPLLDKSDNTFSVFTNENVTFALNSNQEQVDELYNFTYPEFCQCFGLFYDEMTSLSESWLKKDKRAIDYIYNGMKLI